MVAWIWRKYRHYLILISFNREAQESDTQKVKVISLLIVQGYMDCSKKEIQGGLKRGNACILPAWILSFSMLMYISRSGRACSWKNPSACPYRSKTRHISYIISTKLEREFWKIISTLIRTYLQPSNMKMEKKNDSWCSSLAWLGEFSNGFLGQGQDQLA